MVRTRSWLAVAALLLLPASADSRDDESHYWRLDTYPAPPDVQFEPGALDFTVDGRLLIATRIGDVWLLEKALEASVADVEYKLWASGLHEVLGLACRGEAVYITQRGEVTRATDLDGDDRADLFEVVSDDWGLSGDYHEYAFGSKFDADGNLWVVLCLTGSFSSRVEFRGWCVRVNEDGTMLPTASGIRSPGGIGANAAGDMFYTDNQGPWNGTSILRWVQPGKFMGHPGGNHWYAEAPSMGPRPQDPQSGSRFHTECEKIPELMNPAVFFPHNTMGQSASGVLCDRSGGKFGPFADQLFVSDQTHSMVMRVVLEKVRGRYQGVCLPFRKGFGSGNVPMVQAPDGSFIVGGTERGWGARGGKFSALERLVWTGETPFEIHAMQVVEGGFRLTFTQPIDAATARSLDSWKLSTFTYIYRSDYGSPEVDHTDAGVRAVEVADDGLSLVLRSDGLRRGHIHELHADGLRSAEGRALLHPRAWYTLFYLP